MRPLCKFPLLHENAMKSVCQVPDMFWDSRMKYLVISIGMAWYITAQKEYVDITVHEYVLLGLHDMCLDLIHGF